MVEQCQLVKKVISPWKSLKLGPKLAKNGGFFSQFLAAAFLARNVSQIHFSFSREMREMCMSNDDILNKGHAFAKCTVHTYLLLNFAHEVLVCCMITEICIMSRFFFELAKNDFYYNVLCPQICQTPTASKIQASTRTKNPYAISTSLQYFKLKFWKRGLDRTLGYPLPPKCIFTSDDLYFLKDSNCNAMCAMQ